MQISRCVSLHVAYVHIFKLLVCYIFVNSVPRTVPKSGAGVGSNKSAPAASPTLLPKSSETYTVSREYLLHVSH